MEKLVSIPYNDYMKYVDTIDNLRKEINKYRVQVTALQKEITFLKDSGENILVIVKSTDKPDTHEYKTVEKNIISDLVLENQKIRERYDELSRKNDNLENQKSMIMLKYQEMDNFYKLHIDKLENKFDEIEKRGFVKRIMNTKVQIDNIELPKSKDLLYIENPKKEDVKKPRGWNLQPVYEDENGNVYHKGVLQKGT